MHSPCNECVLIHPLVKILLASVGQRNPFSAANTPQRKIAFLFQQCAQYSAKCRSLSLAPAVLADTLSKCRAAVRLICFVWRNAEVKQCVAVEFQAAIRWNIRRDIAEVPSVQTVLCWHGRRATKDFSPRIQTCWGNDGKQECPPIFGREN